MSLKTNQYYLIEEDGRSNYVQNGIVTSRGIRTPLPQAPDGWQGISFAWERNRQRHGIQRAFSRDLGFVLDGATIVRDAFYWTNVDRKMYLLIQKLKLEYGPSSYKWLYETIYKGELDFTTVKDKQGGDRVDVSIMEGGLHKLINANWTTVYKIPFDSDAINVKFDGIMLQEGAKYHVVDEATIQKSLYDTNFFLPVSFINREGELPYMAFSSQSLESVAALSWTNKLLSENYLLKAADNNAAAIDILIKGKIRFTCTDNDPANGFRVRFIRSNQDIANQNDYQIFSLTPTLDTFDYDVDLTIPMEPGERLYLEGIYFGTSGNEVAVQFDPASDLRISYEQQGAQTYAPAFLRRLLVRKLMKAIAGSEEYVISELLDADDRAITCFDAIRGIEDAAIQTSLADCFKDTDADLCIGMGVENGAATANLPPGHRLVIESRESSYDASDPIDLGEAKELEVRSDAESLVSAIKVGWKEPQTEGLNGKLGFNGSQQYTTPIKRVQGTYEIVSPYKADPYEIELARIRLEGKDTTDNRSDKDCAVLWVNRSQADVTASAIFIATGNVVVLPDNIEVVVGQKIRFTGSTGNDGETFVTAILQRPFSSTQVLSLSTTVTNEGPVSVLIEWVEGVVYELTRETYDNEGDPDDFGVPSPTTIFNVDLSPKRMLLRHGRWLASILDKYSTEKIMFQSGTRNTNLKTVQGSVTIAESGNVNISSLGTKIFLPYVLAVKVNGDNNLAALMEENPNRCFKFTWNGVEYKGYNLKAAFAPNELDEQEYLLLSTPDNDLTDLIA